MYRGQFFKDQMTGKGERILSEGDKFYGNFLNGKLEGII
jgi:hypothetical protein